jgi:putative chitinase
VTLTLAQIQAICTRAPPARLAPLLPHLAAALTEAQADLNPTRAAMFLAQLAHESEEFARSEENLNYSPDAVALTWPSRFASIAQAEPFARNPQRLANLVYAGRLGNGDQASGEGWRYRGRGWIQITGRDNYRAAGLYLGVDLLSRPDLAATPEFAGRTAAWFWRTRGLNEPADRGDVEGCTRRIQGELGGIAQRRAYFSRASTALAPQLECV